MSGREGLRVIIRHGDTEVQFEGGYEDVWRSVNRYFSEAYPSLEAVKKLTGAVDVNMLLERLSGLAEIREGRINVLGSLDAKKKIIICLAAAYVGRALGLLDRDKLTPREIAAYTGLGERVVRARLSELRKAGLVVKSDEGQYEFTPASIEELSGERK